MGKVSTWSIALLRLRLSFHQEAFALTMQPSIRKVRGEAMLKVARSAFLYLPSYKQACSSCAEVHETNPEICLPSFH